MYHIHTREYTQFILDYIQGPFGMVFGSFQLTVVTVTTVANIAAEYTDTKCTSAIRICLKFGRVNYFVKKLSL